MPEISIIVPVYNSARYLESCVESILQQQFADFELLLIDDGSTDESAEICRRYVRKEPRIRLIRQANAGVSAARNTGLDHACGQWIAFIDSDDRVMPSYLSDFHHRETPQADLYLQGYIVEKAGRTLREHRFPELPAPYSLSDIFVEGEWHDILNSPVCKLFKRALIEASRLRFDLHTSYGEDHLFVLEYLCRAESARTVTSAAYIYLFHDTVSLTRRHVPCRELAYYTIRAAQLQEQFLYRHHLERDGKALAAINRRLYSNVTRTLKELFAQSSSLHEYRFIVSRYRLLIHHYKGLERGYQKGIFLLLKEVPAWLSYPLFRIAIPKRPKS